MRTFSDGIQLCILIVNWENSILFNNIIIINNNDNNNKFLCLILKLSQTQNDYRYSMNGW